MSSEQQIEFDQSEVLSIQHAYEDMLDSCIRKFSDQDRDLIQKAFDLANKAHNGVRRKSGEPYILHPIAVAKIVGQDIGLGAKSIAGALLHDVVEDTSYTNRDIAEMFGEKVAYLVEGLTKLDIAFDAQNTSAQAETMKKILETLIYDIRVIIIKLADRLHNMRTLDAMAAHKREKVISETLFLYAPLAHRLGFYSIKSELEDLCLKFQHPEIFNEILEKVQSSASERNAFIQTFITPIEEKLKESDIQYEINGRVKSIYSIWKKMASKQIPFEEVYDLFAIRIVFEPFKTIPEKTQCWHIYSLITDLYKSNYDRLRDWVSTPKANGYEALHCTVMGPQGRWVEVQIRSHRMEELAERGVAAHWRYKDKNHAQDGELDRWLKQVREMLENNDENAIEFLDQFKLNLNLSEIVCFTPKGKMISMPTGCSVLDFAYEIHSQIGNQCIGAKINNKLVPLNYILQNGDQIEVLTSTHQQPQEDWLDHVISAKARSGIRLAIRNQQRHYTKLGQELIALRLEENELAPTSKLFKRLYDHYKVATRAELFIKAGSGQLNLTDIELFAKKEPKNRWKRYWQLQFISKLRNKHSEEQTSTGTKKLVYELGETGLNGENLSYITSDCCHPIPGEAVICFREENGEIYVHHKNCKIAIRRAAQHGHQIVNYAWKDHKNHSFPFTIVLEGFDRVGILSELANIIAGKYNVNIRSMNFDSDEGIFTGKIALLVTHIKGASKVLNELKQIKGMRSVKRIVSE